MDSNLIIFFGGAILAILGFFLVKFWNSVEEMKSGINRLLIAQAQGDMAMKELRNEVHDIKLRLQDTDERLREVEIQLAKS